MTTPEKKEPERKGAGLVETLLWAAAVGAGVHVISSCIAGSSRRPKRKRRAASAKHIARPNPIAPPRSAAPPTVPPPFGAKPVPKSPEEFFGMMLGEYLIKHFFQPSVSPTPPPPTAPAVLEADDEDRDAATLLGVPLTATADQIRAALRAKLVEGRLHPDQGGNADEAARLIAAKNLLIERLQAVAQ